MTLPKQATNSNEFSEIERKRLGNRNISFIRGIQKSENLSKKAAIALFTVKANGRKSDFKRFQRKIKKQAFSYGEKDTMLSDIENRRRKLSKREKTPEKKIKPKIPTKKGKKISKSVIKWRKEEKKNLSQYLSSVKYLHTPSYKRIQSGHKQYPDASKYELSHGVNSIASKNYRLRHGLNSSYTGRINK